ncbi:MAG: gluconate 2-dehydrogenase subunit 3 family protein [Saprospiraceae bacterium]
MNRRSTLKSLVTVSGALLTLPGWARSWNLQSIQSYVSSYSLAEQDTLSAVADTIIPDGDSIGALSVGVDKFLQKLFDRCYEKEMQDNIKVQLASLETKAQAIYQTSFGNSTTTQRENMLMNVAKSTNKDESDFFKLLKSETIRGFNTSEEVMTKYLNYKVAPGHFYGSVEV